MSSINSNRELALTAIQNRDLKTLQKAHECIHSSSTYLRKDEIVKFFCQAGTDERDLGIIQFLWDRAPQGWLSERTRRTIENIDVLSIASFSSIFSRAKQHKNIPVKNWALQDAHVFSSRLNKALQKEGDRRLASLQKLAPFSHFDAEQLFTNALSQGEKGLDLIECLVNTFPNRLSNEFMNDVVSKLYYRDDGHLFIALLLKKAGTYFKQETIHNIFSNASRKPSHARTLIPLMLESWKDYLNQHLLKSAFSGICFFIPPHERKELCELIWNAAREKCIQIHWSSNGEPFQLPNLTMTNLNLEFSNELIRMLSKSNTSLEDASNETVLELMDYFIEKLIETEGTLQYTHYLYLYPHENSKAELIHSHLKKHQISYTEQTHLGKFRYTYVFRDLLNTLKPGGIHFYEKACEKSGRERSPFFLRWVFVKAAIEGEEGKPLMDWLLTRHRDQLSPITFARAAQLAERSGDVKTAAWIRKKSNLIAPSQAASSSSSGPSLPQVDPIDIALLLKTSHDPYEASYQPLGDAPTRYGWKPLDHAELAALKPDGYVIGTENPFADSDVTIVEDDREEPLALNEIHRSEANLFCELYALTRDGHTRLKIKNEDADFEAFALTQIRSLLSRPSGRWALIFACRMNQDLNIGPGEDHQFWSLKFPWISLSKEAKEAYFRTKDDQGKITMLQAAMPIDASFQHELLHAIHKNQLPQLSHLLHHTIPSLNGFTSLEEQYTIAGIDTRDPAFHSMGIFALSDNTYQFERGYPGRYDHSSLF